MGSSHSPAAPTDQLETVMKKSSEIQMRLLLHAYKMLQTPTWQDQKTMYTSIFTRCFLLLEHSSHACPLHSSQHHSSFPANTRVLTPLVEL